MLDYFRPLAEMPAYGLSALVILILYALQAELRFGAKARTMSAGPADRGSTIALSLSTAAPIVAFVLGMKAHDPRTGFVMPSWVLAIPGMPVSAWIGVIIAAMGFLLRLWSVMTLRDRYTRTLLTGDAQVLERGGPYRFCRHPGYLGSLLCLNGVAMSSGYVLTTLASVAVTGAAYAYRIRVEDAMMIERFGPAYARYVREVGALWPRRSSH